MKKNVLLTILLLLPLTSCSSNVEDAIMIVSDTHFFANSLTLNTDKYAPINLGSDGRIQEKDDELIDAIIETANKRKPKILIITGDLSFNGEKESHIELVSKLNNINKKTKVLVIPGNHDIYSMNTFSYANDQRTQTAGISPEEFVDIYRNFGYNGAYSYDSNSLSYIYKFNEKQWILMLDTNMYYENILFDYNSVGGILLESTMEWLTPHLEYAKEKGINVISASHQNLFRHNPFFNSGYQLYNADAAIEFLTNYDVKLNFSGHLHIQSIMQQEVKGKTIYEVATNGAIVYGNSYGWLDIDRTKYVYSNNYLKGEEEFITYSKKKFMDKYAEKVNITGDFSSEEKEKLTYILAERNAAYFRGDYREFVYSEEDLELLERFKASIDNYENSYYHSFLEIDSSKDNFNLTINL